MNTKFDPNDTCGLPGGTLKASMCDDDLTWDDATWILTSSFIIFTMQSGELFILRLLKLY